jgi:hypothetical protein
MRELVDHFGDFIMLSRVDRVDATRRGPQIFLMSDTLITDLNALERYDNLEEFCVNKLPAELAAVKPSADKIESGTSWYISPE